MYNKQRMNVYYLKNWMWPNQRTEYRLSEELNANITKELKYRTECGLIKELMRTNQRTNIDNPKNWM